MEDSELNDKLTDEAKIGCAGFGVNLILSLFALAVSIIGIGVSLHANYLSTRANEIAQSSMIRADENARSDRQQQVDIARFEQFVKRPSLTTLRFDRMSDSEFRATVQNSGERQAAVFELEYVFHDVKGAGPTSPDTISVVPTEIVAKTIKVEFVTGQSTKHSFQNVVVMPAGEVIVFRIKANPSMTRGEFVLHFGESEKLSLGAFTELRIQKQRPTDDLFGNE